MILLNECTLFAYARLSRERMTRNFDTKGEKRQVCDIKVNCVRNLSNCIETHLCTYTNVG